AHDERKPSLGTHVRLHGVEDALRRLEQTRWLMGVRDYVQVSMIAPVPPGALHRVVSRVQAKSSPERLRRRAMKRHGIDAETAKERIPDSAVEHLSLPFVT